MGKTISQDLAQRIAAIKERAQHISAEKKREVKPHDEDIWDKLALMFGG